MRLLIFTLTVTLHFSQLTAQDTIRIMPLGNSITHAENRDANNYNSWRRQLFFDLASIINAPDTFDFIGSQNTAYDNVPFPDGDFDPDHEGHWGWRADEIRDNLSSWLTNLDTPDVVLMHLGHNDCFGAQLVASTILELEAIIDTLRLFNPNVSTFVAQVIPSTLSNACLTELNDSMPNMVLRKDLPNSPVILVDQNTGFDAVADTYDGIHPNVNGELKMAARWFGALQGFIEDFLPVDLLYFIGDRVDTDIKLTWGTENEVGIEAYVVEKSLDLKVFKEVGKVTANQAGWYQFVDKQKASSTAYYRLSIVEVDGTVEYSNIIEISGNDASLNIYPTLAESGATLTLNRSIEGVLQLTDLSGKLLRQFAGAMKDIQLPQLPAGTYFIKHTKSGWIQKIFIQ